MKNRILLITALASSLLAGCATQNQQNAAAFLKTIAEMNVSASKIEQRTTGPFYNHREAATGLTFTPTGFSLIDVDVEFNIPLPVLGVPLLNWSFSAQTLTGTKASNVAALARPPIP